MTHAERFFSVLEGKATDRTPFFPDDSPFNDRPSRLADDEHALREFMRLQEERDLKLIRLAASAPGPIVIISDHADESLISPAWYRKYCIPYYSKACAILHEAGKLVSTHLDGKF